MRVYHGIRTAGGCIVGVHAEVDAPETPLPLRLDLRSHCPDGFGWGNAGRGPAQLALAILADFLADDRQAVALHQQFLAEVVCRIDGREWWMAGSDIELALTIMECYPNGAVSD